MTSAPMTSRRPQRPRRYRRQRDQRGLAAPVVLALTALLTFITLLGAVAGRVFVDQRRAAAAADLAALSGATAVQQGRAGCAAAAGTARANGARLVGCHQLGADIDLTVAIAVRLVGRSTEVHATAHAGPVTAPGAGPSLARGS